MNDQISILGIKGFGHHGVFESERVNGQEFVVDVVLTTKLKKLKDQLEATVDYSRIIDLVSAEITSNPVNLIETLAERIAEKVLESDKKIKELTITVHKPFAPVSASVSDIAVSVYKSR